MARKVTQRLFREGSGASKIPEINKKYTKGEFAGFYNPGPKEHSVLLHEARPIIKQCTAN